MDNGISPSIQSFKSDITEFMGIVHLVKLVPELDAQPPEIVADTPRLGIPGIELSPARQFETYNRLQGSGWCQCCDNMIDAFRMEVSAESLEVRSEQDGISAVDLLGCESSAASGAAYGSMGPGDLVQCMGTLALPPDQGLRWHRPYLKVPNVSGLHTPLTIDYPPRNAGVQ